MASLSLRAYLQKIENLIDRGETEEAIAHCKHILNKFPKHVDTYRLLGKSYLEMQRYQEASDVLQRVLSVSPDDFVAQIGMSIIREDSENLDEAIWHMERAFEIQPSNNAVQDELKRLYGRRDGAIPQKILLTRGALVRMYVRGEAYPQAIAEGIAALKEEPLRPDIQLLLAKSYLRTNQINDGYRICQKILESLPYSYEANQLIAEIHILTKQSDQAEPYLERVRMLDPYAAFVNENAPTSAKVDENAIIIDELDYDEMAITLEEAQAVNGSKQSEENFDTSSLEIPTPGDSQPIEIEEDFAWMQEIMNPSESNDQQTAPTPQETTSSEEPDLSELFGDSSEQFDPEAIFSGETQEDNDDDFAAMFAEMNKSSETDTAQSTVQAEDDQSSISMEDLLSSESDRTTDEDLEDFAALFGEQTTTTEKSPATDDDFSALFEEQVAQNEKFEEVDVFTQSEAQEAIQDIASQGIDLESIFQDDATDIEDNASSVDTTKQADDSDELPDWLKELDQETKDSDIEGDLQKEIDSLFNDGDLPPSQSAQTESADAKLDDEQEFTAKFLEELENEPQHPGKTRMFSMTADLSSGDSGPLPPLSEVIPQSEKPAEEEVPDWLKQLEQQTDQFSGDEDVTPQAEQIVQEESAVSTASSLDAMSEEEEDRLREKFKATEQSQNTAQIPADDEDDSFAWLESLAAKQGAAGVEATPQSAIQADETRVEEPVSETAEEPAKAVSHSSIDAMTEEEEERLREQFKSAQQSSSPPQIDADEDDSFAWLESLAAKQTFSETPVLENAVAEAEMVTEDIIEEKTEDATPQKTSTSLDAMTEEEEESLREKFKKSHQTGELTQTVSEKEDDTFAWLESLAAKQGVSEDTLLSDKESRDIDTPEWLQESDVPEQIDETTASADLVDEISPIDPSDEITEEEPVTISKLEQAEIVDENEPKVSIDEPVWVDEFASPEPDQADDLVAPVAELPEAQIVEMDEIESEAVEDADIPVIEQPEHEAASKIETPAQRIIETPSTPDEIPDWLKDLEDQTSVFAMSDEEKAGQGIVDIDDVEIPGWITDVNETLQVELEDDSEDTGDLIPEVQSEQFLTDEDTQEDQSAEAFKAVGLDIGELEKQLVEDNIIEHVNANDVAEDTETELEADISEEIEEEVLEVEEEVSTDIAETIPEKIEETISQSEAEEVVFDIPSDFVNEILQEPEPSGPVLQISEDDNQMLAEMSKLFESNNLADALSIADQLIDKEIYLEKIILELQKMVVDHPLDSSIFIRLGDAYIRNNEIQKALDMYQEAETLLQK